ncbi:hypothetical protein [Roseovarius sp. ZX-A-9]|uniref:hypothetical protein n=1 Tax=Roseovarius sp. ZX-A-9 TaxID=3014783 RepID=UPI00232E4827|nr:hypothetical protein [Roseovarius sp. ZX-A-9]
MVSTSKILTVSYGTFSCTLEGFDDSFDTMKAIAEYFRDLAADDRYFGAEPPTPDAEMLARIAEREIARRVEAHDDNGQIVLRTGAATALTDAAATAAHSAVSSARDTAEAPAAAAPAAESAVSPARAQAPASPATQNTAEADIADTSGADMYQAAETVTPAPVQEAESVADKLRRIRAVAAPASTRYDDTYTEDEHAQDFLGSTAEDLNAALEMDDANEPIDALPASDAYEGEQDIPAQLIVDALPDADEEDAALEAAASKATEEASAAAEMPEMPDTAADQEAAPTPGDDVEDQATVDALQDDDAEDEDAVASDAAEIAEAESLQADDDVATAKASEDSDDDETLESLFVEAEEPADEALADEDAVAEVEVEEEQDDSDAEMLETLLDTADEPALEDTDFADDSAEDVIDDEDSLDSEDAPVDGVEIELATEDTLAQLMADALRDDSPVPAPAEHSKDESAEAESSPAEPPLAARVIKVKRSEIDDAIADGTFVEVQHDGATSSESDDDIGLSDLSPLSDEDEAELRNELAAVEAELQQARGAAQPGSADEAEQKRGKRLAPLEADDQAPRMFDEAATQLEEPESHERRNAIQHLRAAVAATKAERSAGGEMHEDVDDKPYRLDLESAVRPRRPQAVIGSGERLARSERPNRERPNPLKLVAEQRIDTPPSEPIRPRRISRADLGTSPRRDAARAEARKPDDAEKPAPTAPAAKDAGGFTGFAEEMGARDLPDLLEAAAAYMSDVEGQPEFSRPMLMHKLKEVSAADFSREEGLRSFGKLLRDGKLQKLKGGRFTVTDATDFRPRSRAAG